MGTITVTITETDQNDDNELRRAVGPVKDMIVPRMLPEQPPFGCGIGLGVQMFFSHSSFDYVDSVSVRECGY